MNHLLFLGLVIGALSIVGAVASMSRNFHPFDKAAVLPLRGILALLVVAGHCFLMVDLRGYSLATPAVAVFFFVSGYGLMRKRMAMNGSRIEHGFGKAFCKLVPTFVVASGIYYVVRMVEGRPVPLLYNILHGETALPIPFTWYVPAILVLYAIFYLVDRLARRNWVFLFGVTAGVVGYWCVMVMVLHWQFFWWKSVFGFVSGILFATFEPTLRKLVTSKPLVVYAISMLLFSSALYLCTFDGFAVRCSAMQLYLALVGPIVALVMYSLSCPKVFGLIGTVSYELYIVHGAFVFAFERIADCKFLYIVVVLTTSIFAAGVLKKGMEWISERIFAIRRP